MTEPGVLVLKGLRLPTDHPLQRKPTRPKARQNPEYLARYDTQTLAYDLFASADGRGAWAVCPRLLNLFAPFRDGLRSAGDRPVARRQNWFRAEGLFFPDLHPGQSVDLTLGEWRASLPVRPSLASRFAGRRSLLAVNRDNPLSGLRDWARWYRHHHGADAVVLFDNGSTAYTAQDAHTALSDGLGEGGAVKVVSADFPYGPRDKNGRFDVSPRFFQTAMLNIARLDMLAKARSVLSVDVDELVAPLSETTIFEQAEQSRLGLVAFRGKWVYAQKTPPAAHGAHHWESSKAKPCNVKWCAVPSRGLGKRSWLVHKFSAPLFDLAIRRDLSFWHFRQMTTGWKASRDTTPSDLRPDQELIEALASAGLTEL